MKITTSSAHNPAPAIAGHRSEGPGNPGASRASRPEVALSPAAVQLSALDNGAIDIDTARVAQLRAAIASGQIKIDTARIADSILASVRELLK